MLFVLVTVAAPLAVPSGPLLAVAEGDCLETPLVLAVTTGMRSGELLRLTSRAIDVDRGSIGVVASLQPTEHEGGCGRPTIIRSGVSAFTYLTRARFTDMTHPASSRPL